jgi:hypothetical protein
MMGPHPPARMIRLRFCRFGATSYLIDVQYPFDLSRRSSKNEDGILPLKKSSCRHTGELCSNWPEIATSSQKKLILTTKPALVNRMSIVYINGRFNILGCRRSRHTIHHFRFVRFEKAMSYLSTMTHRPWFTSILVRLLH